MIWWLRFRSKVRTYVFTILYIQVTPVLYCTVLQYITITVLYVYYPLTYIRSIYEYSDKNSKGLYVWYIRYGNIAGTWPLNEARSLFSIFTSWRSRTRVASLKENTRCFCLKEQQNFLLLITFSFKTTKMNISSMLVGLVVTVFQKAPKYQNLSYIQKFPVNVFRQLASWRDTSFAKINVPSNTSRPKVQSSTWY